MDVQNEDEAYAKNGNEGTSTHKQAACLECRRSKVKCIRPSGSSICRKCQNANTKCVIPEYHVGRYKGVKNKRTGLEKAIYQVEEAIKKAKTNSTELEDEQAQALQKLLEEGNVTIIQQPASASPETRERASTSQHAILSPKSNIRANTSGPRRVSFAQEPANSDEVTVNNADNPLQLLAIASAIPEQSASIGTPSTTGKISHSDGPAASEDDGTQAFFSPICSRLDTSLDSDPIKLGLVTLTEAEKLFEYFHSQLAHTRWGLDTEIHTAAFVRSRSAFLFTSVVAAAALFLPDTAALSTRLLNHCKLLAQQIVAKRYRSVEIVLAFMVNIPWMIPGNNWASDDETCYYLSTALTIALDLSLNKIVLPLSATRPQGLVERLARSDCIDARKALDLDGWNDIEISSPIGQRLLRTRERTWLALFNLDRGVCLARGRPWTVPSGPLIDTCDTWHNSDVAAKRDGSLVAATALRRDFAGLVSSVRSTCDNNELHVAGDSTLIKSMKEQIEVFFHHWHNTWDYQIQQPDGSRPPYVEILVSHGKLSAYCSVVNHPTAPPDVKQFFRAAGLASALNVMRVAIQSEARMKSMPNNTVIMVSFAACFVLGLSTTKMGNQIYLAPNVKKSIEETADVLERIGSYPEHRRGASALFGRHIKRIMAVHVESIEQAVASGTQDVAQAAYVSQSLLPGMQQPYTLHSSLGTAQNDFPAFDIMTDDQLLQAIQNAKDDIDSFNAGFQPDDGLFMDWLDWPSTTW